VIKLTENKINQYVVFKIGRETYALNTTHIVRIENDKKVREVPNVKPEIRGIITVEEDIVPLVDLRTKFSIDSDKIGQIPFIIVCKIKEKEIVVGFIVDDVIEVIDIPNEVELNNVNDAVVGKNISYIQGIYRPENESDDCKECKDELLIILNVNKLLGTDIEIEINDSVDLKD
jgi:purine-binding chemotaxis protein CheW